MQSQGPKHLRPYLTQNEQLGMKYGFLFSFTGAPSERPARVQSRKPLRPPRCTGQSSAVPRRPRKA